MSTRKAEIGASCFTGALVIAITNPLDCLKQRWQVTPKASGHTLSSFARHVIASEGLFGGLWFPGIVSNMCACTVSVGTRLGLYPMLRDALSDPGKQQHRSSFSMFFSGLAGGALGYMVSAPFFAASRVAQAEAGLLSAETGLYTSGMRAGKPPSVPGSMNGMPTLAHLASTRGLLGLWRGSEVLIARGALMSATQLATYDLTKGKLKSLGLTDGPMVHALASLAASLTLTTAICPLDVTYTRYLVHEGSTPSALSCVRELLAEGGVLSLFRGWTPLWARFLPSSILTFAIYEQARRVLTGQYLD